ncbi:D-serine dehydratase [Cyphellophora attinorum]|uniref:D-serine dehydratase n=1 Tax=Cyphellophora attinorum TaxID=1664694 RepID=A0A0N0NMA9_9EURO|nr:D-serine dehydratase [Phialophora attinorum]KPI39999.1 D-serine dehydratase [Phialophora attinorum]
MLDAVRELSFSFRAHVKTHKTQELTRFQVGQESKDARIIVSTVAEAEFMTPVLLEYKQKGAKVNLLYGIPPGPSSVERLAALGKQLGEGGFTFMIDHPAQFVVLRRFKELTGFAAGAFLKTDAGQHRAGLEPQTEEMVRLVDEVAGLEDEGIVRLVGFYTHNSNSYGGSSPDEAMAYLQQEVDACRAASKNLKKERSGPLIISVGASPTALSIQNILPSGAPSSSSAKSLQEALQLTTSNFELEIHAGVYPLFDMQQVSAQSRSFTSDPHDAIGISVLAEVCSVYPKRLSHPEALISAGCLALAREPCKDYPGQGVVTSWAMPSTYNTTKEGRLIVKRISQEHGIIGYENESYSDELPVEYGQKIRIWPNHACITMAMYETYFVVDSDTLDPDNVVDVFASCRGW